MSVEPKEEVELETGHVLFMDVVGYSKLSVNEQKEIQRQLNQVVRGTVPFRAAETAGKLIRLPVGDGMALVFFNSHEAPVRCALEISEALKGSPLLKLRMGIHSGPISTVTDVNEAARRAICARSARWVKISSCTRREAGEGAENGGAPVIARLEEVVVSECEKGGTAASIKAAVDRAIDKLHRETKEKGDRVRDVVAGGSDKLRIKIGTLPTEQEEKVKGATQMGDTRVRHKE
jgi:hypothetical protein